MRVRLLNDGGYGDMGDVSFPVVVESSGCEPNMPEICLVKGSELIAVGASTDCDDPYDPDYEYAFVSDGSNTEWELVSE